MIAKEKLDMMVDYASKLKSRQVQPNYSKRVHKIIVKSDISHRLYSYMVDLMGYSSFMQIVPSQTEAQPIFRGDTSINNLAQLVCDFDYHYGSGNFGSGIYLTSNKDRALDYTSKHNDEQILTLSLSKNISLLREKEIAGLYTDLVFFKSSNNERLQELIDYLKTLSKPQAKIFQRFLLSDFSKLALILGYDGIVISPNEHDLRDQNYCIFNRGKLQITESEFNRVCGLSKNYKNGFIDFESKDETEFLME